ncbi:MAG: response regulator [Burkholderiaceae bacterium]
MSPGDSIRASHEPGRPRPGRRFLLRLVAVALGVCAGMGLRVLLTPWLGESLPFLFALPAVALVALYAGYGAALVMVVLCAVWALLPWLPPGLSSEAGWSAVGGFVPPALVLVAVCGWFGRAARERVETEQDAQALDAVRGLQLAIVLAAVLPTAFFIVAAWRGHQAAFETARERAERAAQIAHEHAALALEANEVVVRQLAITLGDLSDADLLQRQPPLHDRLRTIVDGLAPIKALRVWNVQGQLLISSDAAAPASAVNVSGREAFRELRDRRGGWLLGAPLDGPDGDTPYYEIAVRRDLSDGSFGGIVSAKLAPDYFLTFYRRLLAAESGLSITLFRHDGPIIARWPTQPVSVSRLNSSGLVMRAIAEGNSSGAVEGASSLDGTRRLAVFSKIDRYPVYVVAAVDQRAIISEWYEETGVLAAFTFPAALALALASWVALRRTRREVLAAERLNRESEQRSRAEEALRQAQKLEALGQLTGGVAHDFNNLLMVVNNNVHLLGRLAPQMADSRQIQAINRAVAAGTKLTRQLLAFARRQPLRPEVISLKDAIQGMLDLLRTTLGSKIAVEYRDLSREALVKVDPAEFELALLNLAINARDAMPDGGRLAITTREAEPAELGRMAPGRYVVLAVEDTGAGVRRELLERVFEPFFTTKQVGHGTGLGLSQVYGFCVQSGGTARMDSQLGVGTTVQMLLPVAAADSVPSTQPAAAPAPVEPLSGHLMLVEDHAEVASAIQPLLESLGMSVEHFSRADAAFDAVTRNRARFDVVLSDIMMPGVLNGLDLALALRREYPDLPVVLMTGYASHTPRAMASGFTVLTKPCTAQTLSAALAAALRKRTGGEQAAGR